MRLLTIGSDRKLFDSDSALVARQVARTAPGDFLDVIVYSLDRMGLVSKKLSPNITAYPTNSSSKLGYLFDALRIAKTLERPDVVSTQDPFDSGIAGYFISRYFGVPLQLQVHTDFLSPYFARESFLNRTRVFLAKFLIRRATSVRVVSQRIARSMVAAGLTTEDKITVLPIFVDTQKIKATPVVTDLRQKYPQFNFIILMASRLTREKNISLAIKAMGEIVKKHPRVGLVIVGDGPEAERLKVERAQGGLDKNVAFEGWNDNLTSYYKTADVFLLTSNYEGYGMTVVEALSAGLPVVMSDVGVAGEIVRDGENGLIFPVNDLAGLVDRLERVMSDTNLRQSMKKVVDNFTTNWTEEKYAEEYRKNWQSVAHK